MEELEEEQPVYKYAKPFGKKEKVLNYTSNAYQQYSAFIKRSQLYKGTVWQKCDWSNNLKRLLQQAILQGESFGQLKKEFSAADYYCPNEKRQTLFDTLEQWLHYPVSENYPESQSLQKSLLAKQDNILYFLLQPNVPPDNNGSEQAVSNVKVKQKISGQFKSIDNANVFAILRSVIDTTIKSGQNVLNALFLNATFETE